MRLFASTVLVSPGALLCAWPAFAQSDSRQPLPTIVVSPTAVPTASDKVASSVTVITGEELVRTQRRTAADALATVPGLNVVQAGGPGGLTSVFMRGTNANHVKVLIDGIDVSDPSNPARVFDFAHLLTGDIDRIEILRGPQSGLYGADAIGGVISITTKKGEGAPRFGTAFEAGSFKTFNQTANVSGAWNRFDYAFNVTHFRSAATPVTPLDLLPPGRQRIDDFYDNLTMSTKLGADVTDNFRVNFVGRHTEATYRFTGDDFSVFPSVPAANQSTQYVRQNFMRAEAVWLLLDGRFKNTFGFSYSDHFNWNKNADDAFGPGFVSTNSGEREKFDWRGVAAVLPGQTLVVGLEQETERLRTDTLSAQNGNKAGYVELQSELPYGFFMASNVRHDDNDRFGGHTTYRIAPGVLIAMTGTRLKASYGTGFKAPTLSQMFVDFPPTFFGNPNLLPEESTGYDVGFEQPLFNDRVRFGVTYFHNDIRNLIVANATFTSYANIGRATTEGIEAFAAATVTERFKLRGDYTYTRAVDADTGLELLRRPRHKASVTATWNPYDPLTVSATVLHIGSWIDGNRDFSIPRLTAPGYTILNLAADYAVSENVTIFGRVDNVFDLRYENPTGYQRPGLGVFGGMRLANR